MKNLIIKALQTIGMFLAATDFKNEKELIDFLMRSKNVVIDKLEDKEGMTYSIWCNGRSVIVSKLTLVKAKKKVD